MATTLTATEQKIEYYCLSHTADIPILTIHQLSQLIGVSPSAISKYIKKMGYPSFSAYKLSFMKQQNPILDEQIKNTDSLRVLQQKLLHTISQSYEQTASFINDHEFEQVIDLLKAANRIYLFGVGASGIVCCDFYFKLSRIGKNTIYHTDSHIQLASLSDATAQDVVLGVSYSASTKEVLTALAYAHEEGIPTISITASGQTNLDKYSTYSLKVPRHENAIRSAAITSRNDSLFLIDLLYLGMVQEENNNITKNLKTSRTLTQKLRV